MTVVEFFDKSPIDNIISTLVLNPERIIFIGDNKEIQRGKTFYDKFFQKIHRQTEVATTPVNKNNLNFIVDALSKIVESEEECVFDLTGGDDLVLAGMGIVYERYRESGRVRMHRFNIRTGTARDVITNTPFAAYPKPVLSVAENVMLYGGVVGGSTDGDKLSEWALTPAFSRAIDAMWTVSCRNPARWNFAVTSLAELEQFKSAATDPLHICVELQGLDRSLEDFDQKYDKVKWLLNELARFRVVSLYTRNGWLEFEYADPQVRRVLSKAGNLLEVWTLRFVRELKALDGDERVFQDSCNGVYIDWDGEFHGAFAGTHDTLNEIDVLAMRGVIPVFISCKNGKVEDDELYKLNTVAQRFGGPHAVKILIATYIDSDKNVRAHLLQRAEDMGIRVIEDVHKKDNADIAKMLRHYCL